MGTFILTLIPTLLYFYYGRGYIRNQDEDLSGKGQAKKKLMAVIIMALSIVVMLAGPAFALFGLGSLIFATVDRFKEILKNMRTLVKEDWKKFISIPFISKRIDKIKKFFGFKVKEEKPKSAWRNNTSEHKEGLVEHEKIYEEINRESKKW